MLEDLKKTKKFLKDNKKIIYIILILLILIFAIFASPVKFNKKVYHTVNKDKIVELFNKINDNYSLTIEENINGELKKLEYSRDSKVILYEGDLIDKDGYLLYENRLYSLNSKTEKLTKEKNIPSFINDRLYDLNLIKKIIPYCEFEYVNEVKANCKINLSSYINEYNNLYNENIEVLEDEKLNFEIIHYSNRIGKINVDYKSINKLINNNDNDVFYGIKIYNIDSNNHDIILEHYKEVIAK